ncbi:hypothetical protein BD410DRAFT_847065 [Rickenella mellea]|uniref:Uncharacterized protein n=1 Tax=Rickenella mellea TaxID=50990 RepID=A0A4Y7PEB1_9AGAM|nr:hypothetical protein BD410DRAFT_847065 [Rickenella mellea]
MAVTTIAGGVNVHGRWRRHELAAEFVAFVPAWQTSRVGGGGHPMLVLSSGGGGMGGDERRGRQCLSQTLDAEECVLVATAGGGCGCGGSSWAYGNGGEGMQVGGGGLRSTPWLIAVVEVEREGDASGRCGQVGAGGEGMRLSGGGSLQLIAAVVVERELVEEGMRVGGSDTSYLVAAVLLVAAEQMERRVLVEMGYESSQLIAAMDVERRVLVERGCESAAVELRSSSLRWRWRGGCGFGGLSWTYDDGGEGVRVEVGGGGLGAPR